MRKKIEIFEHDNLKVDELYDGVKFSQEHFDSLVRWNESQGKKFFSPGYKNLSSKNYVGAVRVRDMTIEILPKTDKTNVLGKSSWKDALLYMLFVVNDLNIHPSTSAFLKTKNISLMDFFIRIFIKEVHTIIYRGLVKKYRQVEKNSNFVKGKILFRENIRRNLLNKEKCFVQTSIYDCQNIYNTILKTAIVILRSTYFLQKSTHDELNNLEIYLERIKPISPKNIEWDNLSYNRKNNHYKKALNLARLIIGNSTPEIRSGKNEVLAFLFDMNKLFEKFIAKQCLRFARDVPNVKVLIQNGRKFWKKQTIRPDLVFRWDEENKIADTKWKLPGGKPSSEDLKQMYVYNIYWQSSTAFLIYPAKTSEENFATDDFASTKWPSDFHHGVTMLPVNLFKDGKLNKKIGRDIIETIETTPPRTTETSPTR